MYCTLIFDVNYCDQVIPIPGTSSLTHLNENLDALSIRLTKEELQELDDIVRSHEIVGDRYAHMNMTFHGNKGSTEAAGLHH